jgi:hypothetical protein
MDRWKDEGGTAPLLGGKEAIHPVIVDVQAWSAKQSNPGPERANGGPVGEM